MTQNPSLCEIAQTFSQAQISKKVDHLNSKLLDICARAIAQASEAPPAIRDWRDLKTAREIMAAAPVPAISFEIRHRALARLTCISLFSDVGEKSSNRTCAM